MRLASGEKPVCAERYIEKNRPQTVAHMRRVSLTIKGILAEKGRRGKARKEK
jgi:hypothetical protein